MDIQCRYIVKAGTHFKKCDTTVTNKGDVTTKKQKFFFDDSKNKKHALNPKKKRAAGARYIFRTVLKLSVKLRVGSIFHCQNVIGIYYGI